MEPNTNKRTKIISVFLSITMILSVLSLFGVHTSASEVSLNPGDTITAELYIKGDTKILSCYQINLLFDRKKLGITTDDIDVQIDNGSVVTNVIELNENKGKAVINTGGPIERTSGIEKNAVLCSFVFSVKESLSYSKINEYIIPEKLIYYEDPWEANIGESQIGVRFSYKKNNPDSDPEPTSILGDVNGDKNVDVLDAAMVQKYAAGKSTLTPEQICAGDVNGDNNADVLDAAMIQKYAAGKITEFPKES